jgi:hypothetical protein
MTTHLPPGVRCIGTSHLRQRLTQVPCLSLARPAERSCMPTLQRRLLIRFIEAALSTDEFLYAESFEQLRT